ncbi:MAG: glycosyltransferase [Gemmatimonadaceae bacterium]
MSGLVAIARTDAATDHRAPDLGAHLGMQVVAPVVEHPCATHDPIVEPDAYLSVIVPAWNGGDRLPTTLRGIAAFLDHQPCATELIVVDDHSDHVTADLLVDIVSELQRDSDDLVSDFTVLRNPSNHRKGYAVSRGMAAASGKYRVFTDADLA